MTLPDNLHNTYSYEPEPHPNLILGSVQLVFWLFFRPTVWRNYIHRIEQKLSPNFCLAELSRSQWRNPDLRRLLLQGCIILPILISIIISLEGWLLGIPKTRILGSIIYAIVASLAFSFGVSLVAGITFCSLMIVAIFAIALTNIPNHQFFIDFVVCSPKCQLLFPLVWNIENITFVVFGFVSGILASVMLRIENSATNFSQIQTKEIILGSLIGFIASGVAVGVRNSINFIQTNSLINIWLIVPVALAFGLTIRWRIYRWHRWITWSIVLIVGIFFALSVVPNIAKKFVFAILLSISFGLPYTVAQRFVSLRTAAIAAALGSYMIWSASFISRFIEPSHFSIGFGSIFIFFGLIINHWGSTLLYPCQERWNNLLYSIDKRRDSSSPSLLRWHSAVWDEFQYRPLNTLPKYLILVAKRNRDEARTAIEYLSNSPQTWAVWEVQLTLYAPQVKDFADIKAIQNFHHNLELDRTELERPGNEILYIFSRLSQDVDNALQQESNYNQRLALWEVADDLKGWAGVTSKLYHYKKVGFDLCANSWYEIVNNYIRELTEASELRQEIDSPYIVGKVLTAEQEIFVGRKDISLQIEKLLLDQRSPPLLLYGQRRMGKTSLLRNLERLLPDTIIPMFVDLQGPTSSASDYAGFLYNIARVMRNSAEDHRDLILPPLTREALAADPFTCFDEWLDEVEQTLTQKTVLLALDEFEALESVLAKERFDEEDVLGMLRHLIQHRPRFKVLLAGSHTLEEFQRWASYLINVKVVHISYLKKAEARQLIEQPVKDFPLNYEFDAVERVLQITRCHPLFVQLLCAEIVALKNEQDSAIRRLVTLSDVEAAVPKALKSGEFFFADIQNNQVNAMGLEILRFMATLGEGAIVSRKKLSSRVSEGLDNALDLLLQRELIEQMGEGYRFQVELIRRWFEKRVK